MRFILSVVCCCFAACFAQPDQNLAQLAQTLGATTLLSYLKTAGLEILLSDGGKWHL